MIFLCVVACLAVSPQTAARYPFTVALDTQPSAPTTTIVSRVMVRVNRLMDEDGRARVTDALKRGGYRSFLDALRALPSVGSKPLKPRKGQTVAGAIYEAASPAVVSTRLL